jgi:hypothetical protein
MKDVAEKMKKKIGTIFCLMLLLSMTSLVISAEEITEEHSDLYWLQSVNSPPLEPTISAPEKIVKNKAFSTKIALEDPDGDKVYYRFKVGKDSKASIWEGPYESGFIEKLRVRIMFYTGDLTIGAQAKDEHGATSDWSYYTTTYINTREINIIGNSFITFLGRIFQLISS